MLPVCGPSDTSYALRHPTTASGAYAPADTPGDACAAHAALNSWEVASVTEHLCTFTTTPLVWPVVRTCTPAPVGPLSMSVQDGAALSMLIISVWVSAAIFKWLARVVSDRGDKDD